jgi:tryptophan 2,3-dioxygenase
LPRSVRLDDYLDPRLGHALLADFVGFPQTQSHEEVVFLRTIQAAELCFVGLLISVLEALDSLSSPTPEAAAEALSEGTALARVLHGAFSALSPMRPEQFLSFRGATGQASAIQSWNYQLLDIRLRGCDSRKLPYLQRIPHFAPLLALSELRPSLKKALADLGPIGSPLILEKAAEFDGQMHRWRGLHLSFAKKYLGDIPVGTGETPGAPYLRMFLNEGILHRDKGGVVNAD